MFSTNKKAACLLAAMLLVTGIIVANLVLAQERAVPADRLIIRFQQNDLQGWVFEVIGRKQLRKVLVPSDELPAEGLPVSGFYYELQSAEGTVLYRRIISNPIPLTVEVPQERLGAAADDQPSVKMEKRQIIPRQRVFTILIPRANVGDRLVLFSSLLPSSQQASLLRSVRQTGAVQEVARLSPVSSTIE